MRTILLFMKRASIEVDKALLRAMAFSDFFNVFVVYRVDCLCLLVYR